jgi:glucose/arabinose dehydrogenase
MPFKSRYITLALATAASGAIFLTFLEAEQGAAQATRESCASVETGISLPPNFCATIFADDLGHVRHMAVADDGTVYANSWSGRYYRNAPPPPGGFLIALRDTDHDGRADVIKRFGATFEAGNSGGTGIAVYRDGLYAETNDRIVRYQLTPGMISPIAPPSTIVSGLPLDGDHPMHPFAIDAGGQLFVNSGSATNNCETQNRQPGSKGTNPCSELATRAGIWLYAADRVGQTFSPKERYATGIRNTGGLSFDAANRMFAVQHGRDQLTQNWPALYTSEQGAETPAEELITPVKGADFGWPYCYYDGTRKARVLAPEYGGDGGRLLGQCATKRQPLAAFPAHWAPNALLIYRGSQFPKAYLGGAFIAFHGSWNRTPSPQDGYTVAFQPLQDGRPKGDFIRFADGFAGSFKEPGRAAHRPAGLAIGPDGALYIADDVKGRIWRITWQGSGDAPLAAAKTAAITAKAGTVSGTHPTPLPDGFTTEQVALGRRIYQGEIRDGTCSGCHGSDGRGSSAGPSLRGPAWTWADGSVPSFARVITAGVPEPGPTGGVMPPGGGVDLTEAEVQAVAAYVWTLGHSGQ